MKDFLHTLVAGLRSMAVLTLILGGLYPMAVWATGQAIAHDQANGSLITKDGRPVGSRLIAQAFSGPEWLWPRPSATDHDAAHSAASNLGPNADELLQQVQQRKKANGGQAPADALTASSSGIDPHISPEYATQQVDRIAAARKVDAGAVSRCVQQATRGRALGVLGEPTVNVLEANLCLSELP